MRGAYQVATIDGFCDSEVVQNAVATRRVGLRAEGGLDDLELAAAIKDMSRLYAKTLKAVVVASGLEGCTASFEAIQQSGLQCYGNHRDCYQADRRKACQASTIPDYGAPYLHKSANGSGGVHIYHSNGNQIADNGSSYRQSYLPGISISHLFLAAGHRIETVGFSTQWHSKHDDQRPFYYGGAINAHYLNESCIAQAEAIAKRLNLKGLNNIDYLYDGTKLYFLELNPRPAATMALYDSDYPQGLLQAHITACETQVLEKAVRKSSAIRAFAIVYSDRPIRLPAYFKWPREAKDVPIRAKAVYNFDSNAPICTLHIETSDSGTALSRLQSLIRQLQENIQESIILISTIQFNHKEEQYDIRTPSPQ